MGLPTYQNDLVLCSTILKRDDSPHESVVTYAINDGDANKSAQAWAVYAQFAFAARFDQQVDTTAVILRTETLKGDGTTEFTTGTSIAAGTRGTNAMSSLPPNCAALCRKNTDFGGRANRGRFYLPYMLNEGEVDEVGGISAGVQADINTCCSGFLGDIQSQGTAEIVIANRVYDAAWDVPNRHLVAVNIGHNVTSIICEPVIATQRRRMPR